MENDSREKERRLEEFILQLLAQKNTRAIKGFDSWPMLRITNEAHQSILEDH